jgi:dissimilatory sulfite reductase (desulfoviridin) alpha/beta subunit
LTFQDAEFMGRGTRCLSCGKCIEACPTGTIQEGAKGHRILIGGKLGRHPRLGTELPGIYKQKRVLQVVEGCLDHYEQNCMNGERFGEILEKTGMGWLIDAEKK